MLKRLLLLVLVLASHIGLANQILVPMDNTQTNHLKAYGLAYSLLKDEIDVDWLLNYRGGSFKVGYSKSIENECKLRAISYEVLSESASAQIVSQISDPNVNMDVIKLHKAAKIAVYSPIKISPSEFENTDAVLLVLKYAEIPFEVIYDEEILKGDLPKYDWLHLHHEDFTGQFGKSLRRTTPADVKAQEAIASRFGFAKVPQMKLAVAKAIKEFCAGGGFLFAMCSGAETFDIALAAEGIDIVDNMDGDGADPDAQSKLDFEKTFAFQNFKLQLDEYEGMTFSDINSSAGRFRNWGDDGAYFSLFDFSAKWDVIPAMLVQNHEHLVREFMGQTTAFSKHTVKPGVLVMGTTTSSDRYIYGELGRGQWTFYGGHDPEGRGGGGRRMPTDLNLYPNSPGYRLILNNVLFPSAKKKKRKT
ncbi:asparagine synthetase B [Dyadobacter sp. LJ53]|uniref:asparagine synthetase B n=1 Tax=Dyadobacter chenwenxiniae TaxID=2906456 RepID=UPI001F28F218|nr:asparagine synthetase B [Dyadobacter chenwenxiniae]MCF0052249.1 asparagine synthetase B [Dyadobacter chenwenxiniae]